MYSQQSSWNTLSTAASCHVPYIYCNNQLAHKALGAESAKSRRSFHLGTLGSVQVQQRKVSIQELIFTLSRMIPSFSHYSYMYQSILIKIWSLNHGSSSPPIHLHETKQEFYLKSTMPVKHHIIWKSLYHK